MKARKQCVLFQHIAKDRDSAGLLIEQLRYAGLIQVVKETEIDNHDGTYGVAYMLEIRCPHGLNDRVWAMQNVQRMKSFGINAADTYEGA